MIESLPHLVNLPPFMFRGVNYEDLNIFLKIIFILKGKLISFFIKFTNGSLFCSLINLFYSKDGKLSYEKDKYLFTTKKGKKFYYPNKRVLRVVNKYKIKFNLILESYCIDSIDLRNGDIVLDCGANVGEVNLALKEVGLKIKYIGFEPDKETFECLKINNKEADLFNVGLSNQNSNKELFIDNDGGNTSFLDFGSTDSIMVESKCLDSFNFNNEIKLLKIDAEGFEPEVLEGSLNTIKNTEFVSVDFGAERGFEQETTIVKVNSLLYANSFELHKFSKHRLIGLYKRTSK